MDSSSIKKFFESSDKKSHVLLNPRRPEVERKWLQNATLPSWPAHIWISSSGTTSVNEVKLIGLSRSAFLSAAEGANQFLQVSARDVWLNVLPHFHVGGLAILARAALSGSRVVDISVGSGGELFKWNVSVVVNEVLRSGVTLLSLVPTQVYDLVREGVQAPASLRAVLVGGGALQPALYRQARELGWPLLPTYGMSELCSQVATVPLNSLPAQVVSSASSSQIPPAELLPHIQARVDAIGRLEVKSPALFSGYLYVGESGLRLEDPRRDGWFTTSDFVELKKTEGGGAREIIGQSGQTLERKTLVFKGRMQDIIKVGGEIVNLARLQALFQVLLQDARFVVLSEVDARLESKVVIAFEDISAPLAEKYVDVLNHNVAPYERIQGLYIVDQLPRTDLGKVKTAELRMTLKL